MALPTSRRPPFPLPATRPPATDRETAETGAPADSRAQEAWLRAAYRQAVNADTWHLGDLMDAGTRNAVLAGIAGATRPHYQGPDGEYYFHNARIFEDAATRGHRARFFAGKTMDQIAAARMPGEDEYVAARRAAQTPPAPAPVANDNTVQPTAAPASPANDSRVGTPRPTAILARKPPDTEDESPAQPRIVNGRVSGMARAAAAPGISLEDFAQAADDYIRLGAAGLTGGYADDVSAGLNAFFSALGGANLAEAYAANQAEERRRTEAARERRGALGALVEAAPGFAPVIGDVSGLLADFRDYLENGDEWTAADWALVAAGLAPGMPNRKTAKAGKKVVDQIGERASRSISAGDPAADRKPRTVDDMLPTSKDYYTEGQARTLNSEPIGMINVREKPSNNARANAHEEGAEGQLYDVESRYPFKPALRFKNSDPKGRDFIKFDGRKISKDHILLIERKTAYPWGRTKGMRQILVNYRKSREALAQNNNVAEGEPVFAILYEMGSEDEVARVLDHMIQEGADDIFSVRVGNKWNESND